MRQELLNLIGNLEDNDVEKIFRSLEIIIGKEKIDSARKDIAEIAIGIDPAKEFRMLARGEKKKKMEKERTKCTHWLSDEEIKMLAKLSRSTGKPKYEVLGASIKYMYMKVLGDEENERKTS